MTDNQRRRTPSDYTKADGFDDEVGVEMCPRCKRDYSPHSGYLDTVYDSRGRSYDTFMHTDPGDGPFFCEECFEVLDANRRANENESLTNYQ